MDQIFLYIHKNRLGKKLSYQEMHDAIEKAYRNESLPSITLYSADDPRVWSALKAFPPGTVQNPSDPSPRPRRSRINPS